MTNQLEVGLPNISFYVTWALQPTSLRLLATDFELICLATWDMALFTDVYHRLPNWLNKTEDSALQFLCSLDLGL